MEHSDLTRRQFHLLIGGAAAAPLPLPASELVTAQAVITRVQNTLGGDWPPSGPQTGVDGFKAGDPNIVVKGIATTAMATVDVLRQAMKSSINLVITFEPVLFGRQEIPSAVAGQSTGVSATDPVYIAKNRFIEDNGLVVYRLHDHWQARPEKHMTAGLARALGWEGHQVQLDEALYEVPQSTTEETVALIRRKLNLKGGLRAVGDRKARVRRVWLYPGSMSASTMWQHYAQADLIVTGEVREWENTHFAADLLTAGEKHGLVTIGRVASEDPGMQSCADWLKKIVSEIPVTSIPAGDLYWRAT